MISRKIPNFWMLFDFGIIVLPFDFKISLSLPNDFFLDRFRNSSFCLIQQFHRPNIVTDNIAVNLALQLLRKFVINAMIIFSFFHSVVAFKIVNRNSSFQLFWTASTTICFLTSGSIILSSEVVSITFQVSWFCHKNGGRRSHLSIFFLSNSIYINPLVNIRVIPEKLHVICD